MSRRHAYTSVSVNVDVDISDVLKECTDEQLLEELASRKKQISSLDAVTDAQAAEEVQRNFREAFTSGDRMHFEVLIARHFPVPTRYSDYNKTAAATLVVLPS